jgi:hypothetical protein
MCILGTSGARKFPFNGRTDLFFLDAPLARKGHFFFVFNIEAWCKSKSGVPDQMMGERCHFVMFEFLSNIGPAYLFSS